MTSTIDWLGLAIIVVVLAAVGLGFRIASGGRMKSGLRRAYFVIVSLAFAILLWNTLAGFR